MNKKFLKIACAIVTGLFTFSSVTANDGVYFTSGNFLVPVKETDISVKKEILTITLCKDGYAKVDVDYTFHNNTSDTKAVTMAFEAAAPYNASAALNRKGEHPFISGFTVTMNDAQLQHRNALVAIHYGPDKREVDFNSPLDMSQWKGYGEDVDSLLPTDDTIYNPSLDSICGFSYAYYFDANFKPGENKVHHTYRYKMAFRVGVTFEVPYWLTPVTRWANGQVDDFTLRIKGEDFSDKILMADSVLKDCEFRAKDGYEVYHINTEYRGSSIFARLGGETVLEWHATNFAPKENILIESGDAIYPVKPEYAIDGKVVITEDGMKYRYLAYTEDSYFIEGQDYGFVPKKGARVEYYEAEKGQGIVYLNGNTEAANVRTAPTTKSKVLCVIKSGDGVPDTYPCLGYVSQELPDGSYKFWFKIKVNGKVGYVSRDLVYWDSINTF